MSLLIGIKNPASQAVLTDGIINIGSVYRKYCKKNRCGIRTFDTTANSVSLQHEGIYHITATLVGSGTEAGVVTVQLLENGVAVPAVFSSETITTADTELRTFVLDYYTLVDETCVLGRESTLAKTITLQNTGVGATFTSVVVNVTKEVQPMDYARRDRTMRRKEMRDMARQDRAYRDGRNPYGSRGGYITSRDPRRRDRNMEDMARNRGRDYGMDDYGNYARESDYRYSDREYPQSESARGRMDYESSGQYDRYGYPFEVYGSIDMRGSDYARRRNSRGQYMSDRMNDGYFPYYGPMMIDYAGGEKLSQVDLEEWYEELCEEIPQEYKQLYKKDNIENVARQMKIEFDKFSPLELTVTATMLATDFKDTISPSDIQRYVSLAKGFLCDKDSNLKYGEKLSSYYDNVVNG